MKLKIAIIYIFYSVTFSVFGQTNTFQNAQGIIQEKVTFYETEGYSIFLQEFDLNLDEKGINKIKKKFSIPKETVAKEDKSFPNIKILISNDVKGKSVTKSIYYISQSEKDKIKVVGFSTLCERVESIEKEFYEAIISNAVPLYIFTSMQVDTIKFAGRSINLGPACHWRGIRNLQCPYLGQMNWSEFSNLERAVQMITAQKALNESLKMGDVLEDNEVDLIFEGQAVKSLRRKLKIKIPKLIMGGSNVLIIYYVVAEVRGRYVACVLSHYVNDTNVGELPPLLNEVMQLKK